MIVSFVKFVAVGFSGLIIDFGFTLFFKEKIKINKYIANSIGVSFAIFNNYLLNRYWTFKSANENYVGEFSLFLVVSIIGLIANHFIVRFLHKNMLLDFYLSKLVTIGIVTVWNFLANYKITFA